MIRDARYLLRTGKIKLSYRAVVVDEARTSTPRNGIDPGAGTGWSQRHVPGRRCSPADLRTQSRAFTCGISIQGRSSYLKINYRTTEQIRAWAMPILQGVEADDLDGKRDDERGYRSLSLAPSRGPPFQ